MIQSSSPVGKIAEKSSLWEYIFGNMALYFECRINKNALLFGDFAHWVSLV